jgi:hypothetical protein
LLQLTEKIGNFKEAIIIFEQQDTTSSEPVERLFDVYARIRVKGKTELIIPVLFSTGPKPSPSTYEEIFASKGLIFDCHCYNVVDYSQVELLANQNFFALFVLAAKKKAESKWEPKVRYDNYEEIKDLFERRITDVVKKNFCISLVALLFQIVSPELNPLFKEAPPMLFPNFLNNSQKNDLQEVYDLIVNDSVKNRIKDLENEASQAKNEASQAKDEVKKKDKIIAELQKKINGNNL